MGADPSTAFVDYGPQEVMKLAGGRDVPEPHMVRANYFIIRLVPGGGKPAEKNRTLGMDLAGTIQATGMDVEGFQVGDAVVADVRKSLGGAFREYAVVRAIHLVKKPDRVSFGQAATVPISGQAAMMRLLLCDIKPGDRILVNDASGGVGSFGVKLAKALGAHVTAMCSAQKADVVKSWGADEVVDYKTTSAEELQGNSYDAVFDAACFESPSRFEGVLKDNGRYVLVGGASTTCSVSRRLVAGTGVARSGLGPSRKRSRSLRISSGPSR